MAEAPSRVFKTPKGLEDNEKLLQLKEYKIQKDNSYIIILVWKTKDNIVIRSLYYEIKFNMNDLSKLTKIIYNSIDECYEFINNQFKENKVIIQNIKKELMNLIIITFDPIKRKEKQIEITLIAKLKNDEYTISNLINKCLELEQSLNIIKEENKNIKKENVKTKQENLLFANEMITMKNDINMLKNHINYNMNNMNQDYLSIEA